jgi:hypothetical protein
VAIPHGGHQPRVKLPVSCALHPPKTSVPPWAEREIESVRLIKGFSEVA